MKYFSKSVIAGVVALMAAMSFYGFSASAQQAKASGEVRRVNVQEGKVTLQHGPISELGLDAMTLVYKVDPQLLANIQPGDKVKFTAQRENGQYIITAISK